jgi:hypothetical protein
MCPSFLAVHGPAPTRPSNKGALLPCPTALLGTNHGGLRAERILISNRLVPRQRIMEAHSLRPWPGWPTTGRKLLLHFLHSGHPWPSGPLPDGNRPEETPAGTRARCARAERRHTDVPSRGPEGGLRTRRAGDGMDAGGRATQGAVAGSPQSVWPGWPSLWLHFSDSGHPALRPLGQLRCSRRSCGAVATQEKVTRAPEACESSVLTMAEDAIKLALKGGPKRLGTYPCPRAGTGAPQTCESFGAK